MTEQKAVEPAEQVYNTLPQELINAVCPDEYDRIYGQAVYTNQNSQSHYWPSRKG